MSFLHYYDDEGNLQEAEWVPWYKDPVIRLFILAIVGLAIGFIGEANPLLAAIILATIAFIWLLVRWLKAPQ